jgi:hypothetical protein
MVTIAHNRVSSGQPRRYAAVPFPVRTGVVFTFVGENTWKSC